MWMRLMVTLHDDITVYSDMFNQMDGIIGPLARKKIQ